MKTIIEEGMRTDELERWQGARATVWMFHATLKRLALRLSRGGGAEVLWVVGVGCRHIVGPFAWDNARVVIDAKDNEARVRDARAGFELWCSSVTVAKGPATDYDTTFDDFLGESVSGDS